MKLKFLMSAMFIASVGFVSAANAAGGTLTFTGLVTADSCTVDTGSLNQTVTMTDSYKNSFSAVGDTDGDTPFNIKLTNCPQSVTSVKLNASATMIDNTNPQLVKLDASSAAAGVGIAIYDDAGTLVPMASETKAYPVAGDGTATINMVAKLMSTSTTVTTGDYTGTAGFTVIYN